MDEFVVVVNDFKRHGFVHYMKHFNFRLSLVILLVTINSLVSCRQNLKSNELNIYVSEDNPGWHFVDLNRTYDTIHKAYHRIAVKFKKGQTFQIISLRTEFKNYQTTFLFNNGDTVKSGLWFLGEYNYDSLQRKFISLYIPSERQRTRVKDYMEDSSYDSLRHEMDSIVENYLRERNELK
jgi:hypothetical protein